MDFKKIVVVDDEKDLCWLIKDILEAAGDYQVSTAFDGEEGFALCSRELPNLIFLDFVMPKANGEKVLKLLKENPRTGKIPVIIMSGLGEMVYFHKSDRWKWLPNSKTVLERGELPAPIEWKWAPEEIARELGVSLFLAKPFSRETLLEVTSSILEKEPDPAPPDEET